jgi:hypothetical protein
MSTNPTLIEILNEWIDFRTAESTLDDRARRAELGIIRQDIDNLIAGGVIAEGSIDLSRWEPRRRIHRPPPNWACRP